MDQKAPRLPEPSRDSDDCDLQVSKSTVPRFTSFKPRQATAKRRESLNELRTSESKTLEKGHNDHAKDLRARKGRHRREKYGQESRKEEKHSKPAGACQPQTQESPSSPVDTKDVGHFIEDRKSDESNVRYGTAHRYTVPKYRESGQRGLLGLTRHFKTTPELEPGRRLVTTERPQLSERHGAKSLRTTILKESGLTRVVAEENADVEVDTRRNYLPLSPHRSRKRRKLDNLRRSTNGLLEDPQENNADDDSDSATGEDFASRSTTSDPGLETGPAPVPISFQGVRERHVQLSRRVDEEPANVDAWLALVQHQDLFLAQDADGLSRTSSNAQKRAVADVKLSIYEKALSKTKGHPLQDRLVSGMMTEGSKVWESQKLAKEWRSVLKGYPSSLGLWVRYLNFRQTNFGTFTYENCLEVFKDCLNMIRNRETSPHVERVRIYVFLRMTTFMREAGFSEHAHALWQAILEHCFYEPSQDQASNELFSFEDFWDSEVPRLGEEGAPGWKNSARVEIEPGSDHPLSTITDRSRFETWTTYERQRMSASTLPARTLDEVDENDPYRVILYSDIQPFLFRPAGAQALNELLEAFLCFCGLPPLHCLLWSNRLLSEDPFLNNSFLDANHEDLGSWFISADRNQPDNFPVPSFVIDTGSLFAVNEHWFSPWKCLQSIPSNKAQSKWTQRSLRQLLPAFANVELLAEYVIAFESQLNPKEARKYAKSLLKRHPSIRVYNAFALLEWNAGNIEDAERVWSTALSMRSSFPEASQQDIILIWRSWLWALLDQKEFSKALRLCLAVPDEKITPDDLSQAGTAYLDGHPTSKLRSRQYLASRLEQSLSLHDPDLSIHYMDVLSLLTYLASNHNLLPSLNHYTITSIHPTIAQSPTTLSLLHHCRARFLHLHATASSSGFRPSDITTPLAESIQFFPSSTILLSLYHFHTRRSLLIDRIRDVIPTFTASYPIPESSPTTSWIGLEGSVIQPLFHIYTELNRPTFAGSTSHSIRSAFERAVSAPVDSDSDSDSPWAGSGANSPMIWKLYVLWEVHVASSRQTQRPSITINANNEASTLPLTSPRSTKRHPKPHRTQSPDRTSQLAMHKAISILRRAIRACPWAKELYVLAFHIPELRNNMQEAELRGFYEMMSEKGLRVHVDFDKVEKGRHA
jgi:tetratricopeptide (TPR) repeat protein